MTPKMLLVQELHFLKLILTLLLDCVLIHEFSSNKASSILLLFGPRTLMSEEEDDGH